MHVRLRNKSYNVNQSESFEFAVQRQEAKNQSAELSKTVYLDAVQGCAEKRTEVYMLVLRRSIRGADTAMRQKH